MTRTQTLSSNKRSKPTTRMEALQEALAQLAFNRFDDAERILEVALKYWPEDPEVLYVYGQMRRVQGRLAEAEALYRRALGRDGGRADIWYHLGQLLALTGRFDDAMAAQDAAVTANSQFAPAHLERGLLLTRKRDLKGAEAALREALRIQPDLVMAKQALSATLIMQGRPREAEATAREGLMLAGQDAKVFVTLEQNLAVALSEQRRYAEALALFDDIQANAPALPRLAYNRGNTLQNLGRLADAEAAYRQAILRDPHDLMAHQTLNELLYRLGRSDFLRSYDDAMAVIPDSSFLPTEKGKFLFLAERYEDARAHFERALSLRNDNLSAKDGLASTLMRLGKYGEAIQGFEEVLNALPDSLEARCSLAECLARGGDASRALEEARKARVLGPENQAALAIEGIALRQLGDAEEAWLNDYEKLIHVIDLEPPEGYSDMASFNRDLELYLAKLHLDTQEHINQTCRKGTKTLGTLFGAGHAPVDLLKSRIDDAVRDYIRGLDPSTGHPLHARKAEVFRYWGSWSIRLGDGGFHTNHVHPRGWISSAYYVALPKGMGQDASNDGALKFGEPSFDAGFEKPVRRVVTPKPGRLVLFPSYFWHGTIAFHGQDVRTTVAFDAIPADADAPDGLFVDQR